MVRTMQLRAFVWRITQGHQSWHSPSGTLLETVGSVRGAHGSNKITAMAVIFFTSHFCWHRMNPCYWDQSVLVKLKYPEHRTQSSPNLSPLKRHVMCSYVLGSFLIIWKSALGLAPPQIRLEYERLDMVTSLPFSWRPSDRCICVCLALHLSTFFSMERCNATFGLGNNIFFLMTPPPKKINPHALHIQLGE